MLTQQNFTSLPWYLSARDSSAFNPSRRCGSCTPLNRSTTTFPRMLERFMVWPLGVEKLKSCALAVVATHVMIATATKIVLNLFNIVSPGVGQSVTDVGCRARRQRFHCNR